MAADKYILKEGQHWHDGELYSVGMELPSDLGLGERVSTKNSDPTDNEKPQEVDTEEAREKALSDFLNGSLASIKSGMETKTKEELARLHDLESEGKKRPMVLTQIKEAFSGKA